MQSEDHIELPANIFDYIVKVPLNVCLSQTEMAAYLERYNKWIKEDCPPEWFPQKTHFLKLYRSDDETSQCLVYYGSGVRTQLSMVSSKYLKSRQFRLKGHESVETMKTRLYYFARLMFLPVKTKITENLNGERVVEVDPSAVCPLHVQYIHSTTKKPTFYSNKTHRSKDTGILVHSSTQISEFTAPSEMESRFESVPMVSDDQKIKEMMIRKGYKFKNFVSHD